MQIVIDIDEYDYDYLIRHRNYKLISHSEKLILQGTVLPKHGRLIDADKTISEICGSSCGCHLEECGHDEPCFSVTRIKSAPTVLEASKDEGID